MIVFAFLSIMAIYLLLETMERFVFTFPLLVHLMLYASTYDGIDRLRAAMVAQVERESSLSALELRRYFSINREGEGTRVSESNPMVCVTYGQVRLLF